MKSFHSIPLQYLLYWLQAVDEHSLHPPFIYNFYTSVIKNREVHPSFHIIEDIRKHILADDTIITIKDYGAGSRADKNNKRRIKHVAKSGLSSPKFSQMLFRTMKYLRPQRVLELGTSLGINTLYMASADPNTKIYSFEGCAETVQYAKGLFKKMRLMNIHLIKGNIDATLPEVVDGLNEVDLVYFDANHSYKPTMRYFETCLAKINDKSLFLFDDIHWSSEMEKAWREIKKHPMVTCSIDIFDAGLVFFDPHINKGHYVLEF